MSVVAPCMPPLVLVSSTLTEYMYEWVPVPPFGTLSQSVGLLTTMPVMLLMTRKSSAGFLQTLDVVQHFCLSSSCSL